ncbi:hypothetical protein HUT06_41075 [Actinomadura sp. NAK00032]|uniref:hypothetical protein n=1 Tax=Actinomadura sp. NAK00032 TaxID=2742128 RepID=UPI001590FFA3|nr:hypothetical protein [Actinomadura sp. NAK00032]QKW39637.1 hypothetical protein HUT06_41075 [Actinomadura sp. NAK00032]
MVIDSVRGAPGTTEVAEPEFVRLLTPEGESVEHPDYPLGLSAKEIDALLALGTLTDGQRAVVVHWTKEHPFRRGTAETDTLDGTGVIRRIENAVNQNRPAGNS